MEEMNLFGDNDNLDYVYDYLESKNIKIITNQLWVKEYLNSNDYSVIPQDYVDNLLGIARKHDKELHVVELNKLIEITRNIPTLLEQYDVFSQSVGEEAVNCMYELYKECMNMKTSFVYTGFVGSESECLCTKDGLSITFSDAGYFATVGVYDNIVYDGLSIDYDSNLIYQCPTVLETAMLYSLIKCLREVYGERVKDLTTEDMNILAKFNSSRMRYLISENESCDVLFGDLIDRDIKASDYHITTQNNNVTITPMATGDSYYIPSKFINLLDFKDSSGSSKALECILGYLYIGHDFKKPAIDYKTICRLLNKLRELNKKK